MLGYIDKRKGALGITRDNALEIVVDPYSVELCRLLFQAMSSDMRGKFVIMHYPADGGAPTYAENGIDMIYASWIR